MVDPALIVQLMEPIEDFRIGQQLGLMPIDGLSTLANHRVIAPD
jgi:hypothetical protein